MIDKECLTRFKKFIFDGPKYLFPLTDGIEAKLFSTLTNAPEKLLHVALSFNNFSIVFFGRKVKFPNFIDFPVNTSVINL